MNTKKFEIGLGNNNTSVRNDSESDPILFWNENYFEVNDECSDLLCLLKECGIFHDNPVTAAKHIQDVWDNLALLPATGTRKHYF